MDGATLQAIAALLAPVYAKVAWLMWKVGKIDGKICLIIKQLNGGGNGKK